MSCDRARRLFGACWDDELTHAEREWLEAHLAGCPACRADYDAYSRALELVGTLPRVEAPPDLVERVLARSRHAAVAPDAVGVRPVQWAPTAAAAAAAVVVVLTLAVLFALPGAPWRAPGSRGSQMAVRGGGPAVAQLVSARDARPAATARGEAGRTVAAQDDPFDHSADVEFILDPVTPNRGRASVAPAGSRSPGVGGERAIISF